MFTGIITRETLRHLLDVAGLLLLLLACQFHSWTLDGLGVGTLLLGTLLYPPFTGFGAKVLTGISAWFTFTFLFAREWAEDEEMIGDGQYEMAFLGRSFGSAEQTAYYERCVYATTPCGRTTTIRAWGDTH